MKILTKTSRPMLKQLTIPVHAEPDTCCPKISMFMLHNNYSCSVNIVQYLQELQNGFRQ